MDVALTGFFRALRLAGAAVSTAEAIDAVRAVELIGYADRANLKAALGVVLAKSPEHKDMHDRVFDRYFSAQPQAAATGTMPKRAEASASAGSTPRAGGLRTGDEAVDAMLELAEHAEDAKADGGASDPLQLALRRAAASTGVDEIHTATQVSYFVQRMLAEMGIAALNVRLSQAITEGGESAQAEMAALAHARDVLTREATAWVKHRFELFGRPATENFLNQLTLERELGQVGPGDMERMKHVVRRLAKKLAARHARRRRIRLNGQLDFRRTMRASVGHGGVPFKLSWKHKRRDKPKIVAVCDVSGSMVSHARSLLLFLYSLHEVVGELHSFAFSARLEDVSAPLEDLPFDEALKAVLKKVGGGSTDYGQAFADLQYAHGQLIDRRTTVIVLGDGRGNGAGPRLDLFTEIATRAKQVLWLCPEDPSRWGRGDSLMLRYQPHCTRVAHVVNAADLERALDQVLETHG